MFFDSEPAIDCNIIPARADGSLNEDQIERQIRLYFPRTYSGMLEYDVIMILSASYDIMTTKQDAWIHDAISDGLGGLCGSSLFSQVPGIAESWSSGLAWQAFPNDAPAVIAIGAESKSSPCRIEINVDADLPILTIFKDMGVEDPAFDGETSRLMIDREGSDVLAWQLGNFPNRETFIAAWEYGEGKTIATGGKLPIGWLEYPRGTSGENEYSPEIVSNMVFWMANTSLIDDVEVFHRMKSDLSIFRSRLSVLLSLKDFIDRFGANTDRIQDEINPLHEIYADAEELYLEHSFSESEARIQAGLEQLGHAEEVARREKDRALLWVYVIEWLAASSTFFVSGFVLWSLMVRRRLYQSVRTTKLRVQ